MMTMTAYLEVFAPYTPYAYRLLGWLSRHIEIITPAETEQVCVDGGQWITRFLDDPIVDAPDWVFNVLAAQETRTFDLYTRMTGPARWYWLCVSKEIGDARVYLARVVHSDK